MPSPRQKREDRHVQTPDFVSTANKLHTFAETIAKVKKGASADANIELTRDECQSIIFALDTLRYMGDNPEPTEPPPHFP